MLTSNFTNNGKHPNAIAISAGIPKWFRGPRDLRLSPHYWMLKIDNHEEYTRTYHEKILKRLNPKRLFYDIGKDSILLCWEAPGIFCHRRIVADWFYKHLGIEVPEWAKPEPVIEKPESEQLTLF